MDAHALRRIALELASQLIGARIVTIYRLVSSSFIFKISKPALRPYLVFRHASKAGFLFLSLNKPTAPTTPDAVTMRLRKYLTGLSINGLWFDWQKPAICLGFAPRKANTEEQNSELYLILDLKLGPYLAGHLPDAAEDMLASTPPRWDINQALESLKWEDADISKPWQLFPFLSPLLRKTLKTLDDPKEKLALLADLETATGDLFLYTSKTNEMPLLSAWPLPGELSQGQCEQVFTSALEALEKSTQLAAFSQINEEKNKSHSQELKREKKRLSRALAKLIEEEEKLAQFIALKEQALAIQAQLYLWPQDAKLLEIPLNAPELSDNAQQKPPAKVTVTLDPLLSVRENMALMFKKAAKGQRGLPHIARRRAELQEKLNQLEKINLHSLNATTDAELLFSKPGQFSKTKITPTKKNSQPLSSKQSNMGDKLITKFISPSGLTLLRGRNAKGNRQALKLSSPFDFWLHAEGGPSAHLIIKLPHPAFVVPEEDFIEAARLVAEKSWQRNDSQARIICALAKDVHPIKGAADGSVRVDKIFKVIQL